MITDDETSEREKRKATITERIKIIAEKLCNELSQRSGSKFTIIPRFKESHALCLNASILGGSEEIGLKYPVKSQDGRVLGLMYTSGDLCKIYFDGDRKIKWPDDWIDSYPPFIDVVEVYKDHIKVEKGKDMDLYFMCLAYYAVYVPKEYLLDREYRMKVARFIPAIVKDVNIFLKILDEILVKYGIDKSEVNLDLNLFDCSLKFNTAGMNDEQIVENVLKRAGALTELRKRFREWLPNDKRREYYESTMLFPEDPFRRRFRAPFGSSTDEFSDSKFEGRRYLCEWPYRSGNPEVDKKYEMELKHEIWDFCDVIKFYNLDGYRLRLAKKTEKGLKFLGKVKRRGLMKVEDWLGGIRSGIKEEDLYREDVVVAVDKKMKRLEKFPLEKIEFLKEDFPEMFK
ncbi:MAG: hypothetical protein ACP5KW_07755 [Thermoproteota archaeon]